MEEEWRDVKGFEGLYMVSNMGNVKSLKRMKWNGRGYCKIPERILKAGKDGCGYLQVNLYKEGKGKMYLVHKLVATAFVENPEGYAEVNHINEIKSDNRAENLEWCDRAYNVNYGTGIKRRAEKRSKAIIGINKISGLILEFPSINEASRQTGINLGGICECCTCKRKSAGGFYWIYTNDDDTE